MATASLSQETSEIAFLVVEDHKLVASTYRRLLGPFGEVTVAYSVADGLAAVASHPRWTGLVIDWHLPDGSGLDAIQACRQRHGYVPALVITGDICPDVVNRAYDLDAEVVSKPLGEARLTGFAKRAIDGLVQWTPKRTEVIRAWQARYDMTPAESFILRSVMRGASRDALPEMLHVSPGTVKTHVHRLLRKTGDPSLDAAALRAMREIVAGSDECIP